MSSCNLGAVTIFGRRASGGVCSRCGAVSVFLGGKLYAMFDEDGEELRAACCAGLMQKGPIHLKAVGSDTLLASRGDIPIFQIVERGEALEKMSPG